MAVSEKINALLQIRGVKKYELAEYLIKISGFLNCTLAFEIDERQKIILDESDIRE